MNNSEMAARLIVIEKKIVDLAVLVEQLRQDALDSARDEMLGSQGEGGAVGVSRGEGSCAPSPTLDRRIMLELTDEEVLELHNVVARATHLDGLLSPCECGPEDDAEMCVACSVITKMVDAYFEVRDRENLG